MAKGAHYDTLASVYEFLMPDELLDPAGSFAAFRPWLEDLEPGAPVLDCACGPGHVAVGLAQAGLAVTATDASPAMTAGAAALAARHGVDLAAETLTWDELGGLGWDGRFAAVLCVGNSLAHAEGTAGRARALRHMAQALRPGGRLVVTSRNWELVRAAGSRLAVGDRVVERHGRRGLVVHRWVVAGAWDERHGLDVAVALLAGDGAVTTACEALDLWPFRHADLLAELGAAGMHVQESSYRDDVDRYLVVARRC